MNKFGRVFLAASIALMFLPPCLAAENKTGAKNLFYRQIQDPSSSKNVGLTYSIELIRNGKIASVDSRFPFRSGDQLRFHVQANTDGYLYIAMKEGSKGDSAMLFPAEGSSEDNQVKAGQDIVVPAKGVLEFDNTPGKETVKLVFSQNKLEGDVSKYGRSVLITPKQGSQNISAQYLLEFASPTASDAQFQNKETPPAFAAEPALTVVSTDLTKPLNIDLVLSHSGKGEIASASPSSDITSRGGDDDNDSAGSTGANPRAASNSQSSIVTDKWALVIGISEFKDPKWNLMYPAKDAQDFANFLIKEGHFAPDHVKVLTDKNATRENILGAFGESWLPANVKPGDIALVYMATHGTSSMQDAKHFNYLVAYDTDPTHPFSTGIQLQELVKTIKHRLNDDANRLILVLDTCHSGAAEPGAKGLAAPTFDISDLVQGTGQLIIASAAANQTAHDSMRYKNGIFTKHFMDGLRQNKKLFDAFSYTQRKVAEESKSDFKHEQTPVIKDSEWKGSDVVLTVPPAQPRLPVEEKKASK